MTKQVKKDDNYEYILQQKKLAELEKFSRFTPSEYVKNLLLGISSLVLGGFIGIIIILSIFSSLTLEIKTLILLEIYYHENTINYTFYTFCFCLFNVFNS